MKPGAICLPLVALITGARLFVAASWPITDAEAYYWLCSQRMDLAFFDGPSGTAAAVKAGMLLAGSDVFGIRLFFPFFAALASLAFLGLADRLYGVRTAYWSFLILNLLPGFNLSSVQVDPRMPVLCALLMAAYFAHRALDRPIWWAAAGLALCAGTLFTYWIAVSLVSIFACLLAAPHRKQFLAQAVMAGLLCVIGLIPGLIWNVRNDWAPLALGTWRSLSAIDWPGLPAAIYRAVGVLGVAGMFMAAYGLFLAARDARLHLKPRFLLAWAVPPFIVWIYLVLHSSANPLDAVPAVAILVVPTMHALVDYGRRRLLAIAATIVAASTASISLNPENSLRQLAKRESGEAWQQVVLDLASLPGQRAPSAEKPPFFIAENSSDTALLLYFLERAKGASLEVFVRESQDLSNQFGLWPRYDEFIETANPPDELYTEVRGFNPYIGRNALYLTDETSDDLPQTIKGAFRNVTPAGQFTFGYGGAAQKILRLYLCTDYQTMPL